MTGIGAFQVKNWGYNYFQSRFSKGRLFAQAFMNITNSGVGRRKLPIRDEGTFNLRTGVPGDRPVPHDGLPVPVRLRSGLPPELHLRRGLAEDRSAAAAAPFSAANEDDDDRLGGGRLSALRNDACSTGVDLVTAIRVDDHSRLT